MVAAKLAAAHERRLRNGAERVTKHPRRRAIRHCCNTVVLQQTAMRSISCRNSRNIARVLLHARRNHVLLQADRSTHRRSRILVRHNRVICSRWSAAGMQTLIGPLTVGRTGGGGFSLTGGSDARVGRCGGARDGCTVEVTISSFSRASACSRAFAAS